MVLTDVNVLIGDKIVELGVVAYNGVLHKYAVLDLCALADLYASEQHAVLYLALDDAAVSHKRILDCAVKVILCGSVIADLCIDRSLVNKYFLGILRINKHLVSLEVALDAVELGEVVIILICHDFQIIAFIDCFVLEEIYQFIVFKLRNNIARKLITNNYVFPFLLLLPEKDKEHLEESKYAHIRAKRQTSHKVGRIIGQESFINKIALPGWNPNRAESL